MTLGEFLRVYDRTEPFWINYSDGTGYWDAEFYSCAGVFWNAEDNALLRGDELPYSHLDEVSNITHDGESILTIELCEREV